MKVPAPLAETRSASSGGARGCGSPTTLARDRPGLLGAFLPREAALKWPQIDQAWHVADHIVLGDPRVSNVEAWLKHGLSTKRPADHAVPVACSIGRPIAEHSGQSGTHDSTPDLRLSRWQTRRSIPDKRSQDLWPGQPLSCREIVSG